MSFRPARTCPRGFLSVTRRQTRAASIASKIRTPRPARAASTVWSHDRQQGAVERLTAKEEPGFYISKQRERRMDDCGRRIWNSELGTFSQLTRAQGFGANGRAPAKY